MIEFFGRVTDTERDGRQPGDFASGCGEPEPGESGRVCAGTGSAPSCQLCPRSPNYWDRETRDARQG